MEQTTKKLLFSAPEIECAVTAMAQALLRTVSEGAELPALIGIHQNGVPLARKLARKLAELGGKDPDFGMLDITMYRDDFGDFHRLPAVQETVIPFDLNDRKLLLVDDVLSSGRTIRAALDALTDFGRPAMIRLAVLVDRGNPEFPIHADFVGMKVAAPADRRIQVEFSPEAAVYETPWHKRS